MTGIGEFGCLLVGMYLLGLLEAEAVESKILSIVTVTELRSGIPLIS